VEPSSDAAHALGALEHFETQMRQILVYSTNESLARDSITPRADQALALAHESQLGAGRLALDNAAPESDSGLVLVSERQTPPSVGDLQSAGELAGGRPAILGIIPGGTAALEDGARQDGHSRRAIDRLARRIAGLTVGLSLGGGGAKGYAHLGALRVLERAGVPFDCITGCSIGGPVGVGMAAGWSLDDIRACLDGVGRKAVRPHLPLNSILSSSGIEGELRSRMGDLHFEDLTTPVGVTTVDIETGDEVLLRRGVVWPATLASMTIPGIYEPVRIDGRYLVDGGVRSPDPVKAAVSMGAGLVISSSLTVSQDGAADAHAAQQHRGPPFIVDAVIRSLEIMQNEIRTETSTRADVTILPAFAGPATILDFSRGPEFEEAGERAAEEALPRMRQALPWLS
ncbi:MAG: patatin-like phospholipase family protein, partial [Dehalococcoidia bacterium]|nr:patatin-like phospholipase family protein [Dehalococcoidia bacterium]